MKLTKEQFVKKVKDEADYIGIGLSEKQLENLYLYKEILLEWNEKINLTAITDDEEIISKHIIDSLESVKYIKEQDKIIDVGTGAGLPGVIIAIYFEGKVDITLFDALNKRIIFLQEVIKKLQLTNIKAVHGRAEETAREKLYREAYDVVVSRAVARLNVLMELTVPFVKVNGLCLYMKSDKADEEVAETKNAEKLLNIKFIKKEDYIVHGKEELKHNNIIYKKTFAMDKKYPRQFSKIKTNPL